MQHPIPSDSHAAADVTLAPQALGADQAARAPQEPRDIVTLFRRQARLTPDNVAVRYRDQSWSYREVDAISDRIAAYLREKGVRAGDVVSILIPRGEHMVFASLGALKAAALYQPLDPSYPTERLEFMISDAEAKLLIADRALVERVAGYQGETLFLDEIAALPEPTSLPEPPGPQDGFILLYTSGSTGTPKGVILEHHNLCNFCHWYRRYYQLAETDRVAAYASYGFDACMMDLYPALTTGAAVVIVPEEIRLDLVALQEYFEANGVTHSFMTTQVGRQFAEFYSGTTLRHLSVGGETLAPLAPQGKSFAFYNAYGPTECTIFTTVFPVDRLYERVPIGKPLDNVRLYVVNEQGEQVAPGESGELWVAGAGVGRGYLKRPDKTAATFIANPFTQEAGYERVYRTGDIVTLLPDGSVDFLGRNDSQVKIRGFRIELAEVEAVVRAFPGVTDATVQAFDAPSGGKYIVAYLVGDAPLDTQALSAFIAERKPPYMVPEAYVQLDAIPLTQNQKVDKRALPRPAPSASARGARQKPNNDLQRQIAQVVGQVVGTDDLGVDERFVDLGLSSILAIRLATLVYEGFGVRLNVRELVDGASIQTIERAIRAQEGTAPADAAASARATGPARLSFAQQGVYIDCVADPTSVRYNLPFALTLPEGTSAEELVAAVRAVIAAHPYVLCRFVPGDGDEIVQEPMPDATLDIPVTQVEQDAYEAYERAFVRPFDLATGPCVRFEVVQAEQLHLLVDLHHLVSDGGTVDLFFQQLCQALDGQELQPERYSYYDFVADERIDDETEAFFRTQMADVEQATELIPDVYEQGLSHLEARVSLPADFAAVRDYARAWTVTPAAVYLAALELVVGRYVCEDAVSVVTVSNGRSDVQVSNTFGMFVNTLPLTITLDHREACQDFIRRVAQGFSATLAHESYPFARVAALYNYHPSVSYAYQIGVLNEYRTQHGVLVVREMEADIVKVPVSVFVDGTEDDARLIVAYDSALYSAQMMTDFVRCWANAVRGLVSCASVADISITDAEQQAVLDTYNRPWDLDYDRSDSVATRFKRMVATHADKPAIVFQDVSYSYRELDELTDSLAARIYQVAREITGKDDLAEEVVALILPRDEQTMILPLAVVKAGMGYEPLDPSYPAERLNYMVQDAGACLLIAEDGLQSAVDAYQGAVLTVDELYRMETPDVTPVPPRPESLFIMLYTSGSTGAPKGVQIENGNIVAYAHGMRHTFYTEQDNVAAYASFSFDVNMADVFCSLLVGATVHLVPEEARMDLGRLAAFFDASRITTLLLTTQVGVQFLRNYPQLETLRLLVMGGEKLPAVDPSGISYTIANGYGPTENCCGVSVFPIEHWEPNIPIGRPIPTIHAYVLDKTGHRLPAGAAGEYCLSGPQTSRGYLNRPDKTAEAYEDCPFNEFRMYHTGDIVRYRASGDVEFVGRKDGQVKIRGFRIETKEVEATIRGFEGVRDVTVQAYDYEGGGKYLAAFVVCDGVLDADALAAYVKSQKPAYMVPSVIMQIDRVPLTINQKVDRKALPTPVRQQAHYVAPEGKTEEELCEIFGNVLGVERVGAEDDFFDIGGSSILAMKVVLAAEKQGHELVYNDVFAHPSPRAMAAFLAEREGAGAGAGAGAGEGAALQGASAAPQDLSTWTPPEVGPDGYDYRPIHELLSRNTLEAFRDGTRNELGDVLLLGATGYLGSHVLHELLRTTDGTLYCLVRPRAGEDAKERLVATQRGYFGDAGAELAAGARVQVIEGDATDAAALEGFQAPQAGLTAINCAANVKHFAKGDEIERMNVDSVRNLAAWCERNDARLVHISTGSVMGYRKQGLPPESFRFDEQLLYAGQTIDNNQYVHSKFLAERHIYEEVLSHGLRAKVLRVGNLAPRDADGVFQANYRTNSYMNTLRAHAALGAVDCDVLDVPTEFSPIDAVAQAVLALATTPDDCICFAPLNPHRPLFGDVIRCLNEAGHPIRAVEGDAFGRALADALADDTLSEAVSSLLAYDSNDGVEEIGVGCLDCSLTTRVLRRLGFAWPETGSAYMHRFVGRLEELGFFGGGQA